MAENKKCKLETIVQIFIAVYKLLEQIPSGLINA
jgi:hypothetical protein